MISYAQFRTGLTFGAVSRMLWDEAMARKDQGCAYADNHLFVRRKTVLGRWHQLKREAYEYHLRHGEPSHG